MGDHAELTPEAHVFFYDRYSRLAAYHRAKGHARRAARLQEKARKHFTPDDAGPPYAGAMAMRRPSRLIRTVAVGHISGPDDAA